MSELTVPDLPSAAIADAIRPWIPYRGDGLDDRRVTGATEAVVAALAAEATEPPMCRNGHPFEPGIDIDDPEHPDPKWCNVCGEATEPPPVCPYIVTTDDATSYCSLAASAGPVPDPQGADERWCVKHTEGWCAVIGDQEPQEGDTNVPTLCSAVVVLPWGFDLRHPTCGECLTALAAGGGTPDEPVDDGVLDANGLALALAEVRQQGSRLQLRAVYDSHEKLRAEVERLRAALRQIDANNGGGCSKHTKGNCWDDPALRRDATYGADQWCESCIALDALRTGIHVVITREDRDGEA